MNVHQIPSLDGMRAISVLIVLFSHMALDHLIPGGFGVTVFFFLSGYLITTLMRAEHDRTGGVSLRNFWLRRALRILPPFYLVLAGAVAIGIAQTPEPMSTAALTAQALHATNYWIVFRGFDELAPGTAVYWSLAVEEHFYLLFPLLYIAFRRHGLAGRSQALLLWGLCAAVLVWRIVLIGALGATDDRTYHATDTRIDSILFGCALAVWHNPALDGGPARERLWKFGLLPAALILLLVCFVYRDSFFRETFRYTLQGVALTGVFIAAIRFHDWLPFRFLNWRPVAFIGVLSYPLYLVHYPLIQMMDRAFPDWPPVPRYALAGLLAFIVSFAIHVVVEKPCARLRKQLSIARVGSAGYRVA